MSSQTQTVWFHPLNLRLRITAPRPQLLRDLRKLLSPFQGRRFVSATHHIELRARPAPGRTPTVQILIDNRSRYRSVPVSELVPYLEWLVNDLVVRTNGSGDRYCLIHAAVVARGSSGVLICGQGGCGKSSLSLALMQHHYRYLTDEIACWNARLGRVIAYPKAITLKEDGYRRFRLAHIGLPAKTWQTTAFEERLWYINPADISPRLIGKSARIRLVIFPAYRPAHETRLRPLSMGRAILLLHRHRFDGNGFGRRDFDALTGLVRDASAFRLVYDDVLEAAASIDRLVRQQRRA